LCEKNRVQENSSEGRGVPEATLGEDDQLKRRQRMTISIGRYSFVGPFGSASQLEDKSGVYAILTLDRARNRYIVLDIGESATVQSRVLTHERAPCWQRHNLGGLACAACYTPRLQQAGRMVIEQELRRVFSPPCGAR
jgi:hypothetical protein